MWYNSLTSKYKVFREKKAMLFAQIRSQGRGELLVSLCWQPAANRLTVVVLKARNLPKMDVTGLAGKARQLLQYGSCISYHVVWTFVE
jgi:hypothetical protein